MRLSAMLIASYLYAGLVAAVPLQTVDGHDASAGFFCDKSKRDAVVPIVEDATSIGRSFSNKSRVRFQFMVSAFDCRRLQRSYHGH